MDAQRLLVIALSLAPPALVGYVLERPIAERLGAPRSIAAGLALGAVAMALADRRCDADAGARRHGHREARDARATDGLALGLAQAAALIPGVSRNGATLSAARARGFSRAARAGAVVACGAARDRRRERARGRPHAACGCDARAACGAAGRGPERVRLHACGCPTAPAPAARGPAVVALCPVPRRARGARRLALGRTIRGA